METILVNASALKNAACGLRLFNDVYIGYTTEHLNNDTHFGSAFHKFRAEWKRTGDQDLAMALGLKLWNSPGITIKENKKFLTTDYFLSVCDRYAEKYKDDNTRPVIDPEDGKYLIEPKTKFNFPFLQRDGVLILIAGTMDDIEWYEPESAYQGSQSYLIEDCKTSGAYRTYDFFDSYILNPQLLLYRWTIKKYAEFYPNSIWKKIHESPNVGARIDGVFIGGGEKNEVVFKRSKPIVYKDWQLDEFETMLKKKCEELIDDVKRYLEHKVSPPRTGVLVNICGDMKWGPCKYVASCGCIDEEQRDAMLEKLFVKKKYNPLRFGGE
jgi:hypothetical protein